MMMYIYSLSCVVNDLVAGGLFPLLLDATKEQLYSVLDENPLTA